MTNFSASGNILTDTTTASVSCRGSTTLSTHLANGAGTWTWQFKGPDGVWRTIIGGSDGVTAQQFTASNMINVYFGGDVSVRGNATAGSSPDWDWQIIGNYVRQ